MHVVPKRIINKGGIVLQAGLQHFLVLSSILFSLGLYAIVSRKNAIMVLMGVELVLNAANINFVAFARYGNFGPSGQLYALFVIVLAAAEAAVALAIVINLYRHFSHVNIDEADNLKE